MQISPITNYSSSKNSQQTFCSIKPTIRVGENALREFRTEYPRLVSTARIQLRAFNLGNDPKYGDIKYCITNFINKKQVIYETQKKQRKLDSFDNLITLLVKEFTNSKLAQCTEMTEVVQYNLLKKGIKADLVGIKIYGDTYKPCEEHCFILLNIAPKGQFRNPSTWGSKAVIIDPLLGECKPAKEMLLRYETLFKIDKKKDRVYFIPNNFFDKDKFVR